MASGTECLNIVFFGTPGYAVPALEMLLARTDVRVSLVVTQPDRPAGRGRALQAPPLKRVAEGRRMPVFQPESLRPLESREVLRAANADLFVVAAYGLIFGRKTLGLPRLGCLNLHASILPRYRGASPVTAAILDGDLITGVTLMQMDAGMDTGGIVATTEVEIVPTDTTVSLTERLAIAGAQLLEESLWPFANGNLVARPQSERGGSVVRPLIKADGWIDWRQPAVAIERLVRAMHPWPRAWTTTPDGATLQLERVTPYSHPVREHPGTVIAAGKSVAVACGDGAVSLELVQPAGASRMTGFALVNGRRIAANEHLGAFGAPETPPPLIQLLDSI